MVSFFVTVSPVDDCVPKFFRVYMTGISGDDMVKQRLVFTLFLFVLFSLFLTSVDL